MMGKRERMKPMRSSHKIPKAPRRLRTGEYKKETGRQKKKDMGARFAAEALEA
jgi:hypothetical protein